MMTQEEAIEYFKMKVSAREAIGNDIGTDYEAYKIALTALRPVSRERVERMRGEWQRNRQAIIDSVVCAKCGTTFQAYYRDYPYCPRCGAPMTDEAVEMVMERMEALKDEA